VAALFAGLALSAAAAEAAPKGAVTNPLNHALDGTIAVPSGQLVIPYEALWEDHAEAGMPQETWLVLRFLAPDIARDKGKIRFADAAPDLDSLCKDVGLPLAALTGGGVDQILVVLLDQPLARGAHNPAVTKFMSAYRIKTGRCEWE